MTGRHTPVLDGIPSVGMDPTLAGIVAREPTGRVNGQPYWQFSADDRGMMGRALPRVWRIDWAYIAQLNPTGCWHLMDAGSFYRWREREERAAREEIIAMYDPEWRSR